MSPSWILVGDDGAGTDFWQPGVEKVHRAGPSTVEQPGPRPGARDRLGAKRSTARPRRCHPRGWSQLTPASPGRQCPNQNGLMFSGLQPSATVLGSIKNCCRLRCPAYRGYGEAGLVTRQEASSGCRFRKLYAAPLAVPARHSSTLSPGAPAAGHRSTRTGFLAQFWYSHQSSSEADRHAGYPVPGPPTTGQRLSRAARRRR